MSVEPLTSRYREIVGEVRHRRLDLINPVCLLLLSILGIVFIRSAQIYTGGGLWQMQAVWLVLGLGVYAVVSAVDYQILLEKAHWLYLACLGLLLLVWTPLGVEIYGSQRWIDFGVFNLQPSELAKIATMIMIAGLLARSRIGRISDSLSVLAKVGLVAFIPVLCIVLQPDLGSALVFPPMVLALLYMSKLSDRFFLGVLAAFVVTAGVIALDTSLYYRYTYEEPGVKRQAIVDGDEPAYQSKSPVPLRDYQRIRILTFAAPELIDPKGVGDGWNVRQSLISIGSGGAVGKGIGQGTQALLGYLPSAVAHNDFIFAVLAEESGFVGGVIALSLYGILILNGFRIAGMARDRFGMLLSVGVSTLLLIHVFINVGMNMGLTPVTGLPLPFMSYGGSFMLSCCALQGLVQSVYRYRKEFT